MSKKILIAVMALTLAAWLTTIPRFIPAAAAAQSFKDTGSHWSKQVVEKSCALGLMKGYPGNVFRPEDPVSRLEAIAIIIRVMGLEEEAKKIDYKNSGINLPQGMYWGQGHLVLAVQKKLLREDLAPTLKYSYPITRQEVAALVAAALWDKLKDRRGDVQKLSFRDTAEIGPEYPQYVADVTQNNIMQGLGDNRFGPGEFMKRGELAALMAKTVESGWFEYGAGAVIAGTLTTVDSSSGIITITKTNGEQIPRLTDSTTVLFKDSKEAVLADFKTGEAVLAIAGADARIKYMESAGSTTPPAGNAGGSADFELTGKIVERTLTGTPSLKIRDSGYREQSYPLADTVIITSGTDFKDRSYLAEGTYVTVRIINNAIQSVSILSSEETQGEVTDIGSGYFTLKPDPGSSRVFRVNAGELKIARGGDRLPFSDLKAGDRVQVVSVLGEAREIILGSSTMEAEVRTIDYFYRMTTLLHDDGKRKEYEVEVNAPIIKNGDRVRLDALEQGDRVRFKVGSSGKITEIETVGEETVEGEVTDLRTGSEPRIYVDSTRYYIDDDADITRDGDRIDLEDVMIGAGVTLQLDEDDKVTGIEVTNDEDIVVEGTVTGVSESNSRITIEQSNGLEFTLRVNSDCDFRDSTSSSANISDLGDIEEGWEVKLYLENGRVETVRVMDR
ncbi:MAG: S-layer homology domain-containing protein [Bacillota bacterium]